MPGARNKAAMPQRPRDMPQFYTPANDDPRLRPGAEYLALFWQSRVLAVIEQRSLSPTLIEPYAMRNEEG
jgi:hypothetical protein